MERRGQETREGGCRLEEEEEEGRWDNEREGRQETRKGICRLEKEGDRSREKDGKNRQEKR